MNLMLAIMIAALFCAFTSLEASQFFVRIAAARKSKNAIGTSLERSVNTLKRIPVFVFPLLLGILVTNHEEHLVTRAALASFALAAVATLIMIRLRMKVVERLERAVDALLSRRSMARSLMAAVYGQPGAGSTSTAVHPGMPAIFIPKLNDRVHWYVIILSGCVYGFIGASAFVVNVGAIRFPTYAPIILQATGLLNGVASVVLSFQLDPIVSRSFESSTGDDSLHVSYLLGMFVAYTVVAPAAVLAVSNYQ